MLSPTVIPSFGGGGGVKALTDTHAKIKRIIKLFKHLLLISWKKMYNQDRNLKKLQLCDIFQFDRCGNF